MAALVFRTQSDYPHAVEILGVGVLGGNGRGGIPIERAARVMGELQSGGVPLEGDALAAAARAWAKERNLDVRSIAENKVALLPQEMGALPEAPPAGETAEAEAVRIGLLGQAPVGEPAEGSRLTSPWNGVAGVPVEQAEQPEPLVSVDPVKDETGATHKEEK